MSSLYLYRETPGSTPAAYLRPFAGGSDQVFSTRDRDVVIGQTKPSAATTGVLPGSTLTTVPGFVNTVPGIYENLDIQGSFINQAPGLTILRNSRVRRLDDPGTATGVITNQRSGCFLILLDVEVSCGASTPWVTGVLGGNITARHVKVHDVVDMFGIYCTDSANPDGPTNTIIEACYGYSMTYYSPDPTHADTDNNTHNDGIQLQGGSGLVSRGNRFDMNEGPYSYHDPVTGHASGGLIGQGNTITPTRGATNDFLIESNWFDYGMRGVIAEGTAGLISGTVRNNRFGRHILTDPAGPYGPIVARAGWFAGFPATAGPAGVGNVYDDDGSPVPVYYRGA